MLSRILRIAKRVLASSFKYHTPGFISPQGKVYTFPSSMEHCVWISKQWYSGKVKFPVSQKDLNKEKWRRCVAILKAAIKAGWIRWYATGSELNVECGGDKIRMLQKVLSKDDISYDEIIIDYIDGGSESIDYDQFIKHGLRQKAASASFKPNTYGWISPKGKMYQITNKTDHDLWMANAWEQGKVPKFKVKGYTVDDKGQGFPYILAVAYSAIDNGWIRWLATHNEMNAQLKSNAVKRFQKILDKSGTYFDNIILELVDNGDYDMDFDQFIKHGLRQTA